MVNGKWSAFKQRFSNQWPLKALYNIPPHSPIRSLIHPPTAVSTAQGDSQLLGNGQGEGDLLRDTSTLG